MRAWLVAIALSVISEAVCSQPANDAITRLKSCFQLERALQGECLERLSRDLPDRRDRESARPAAGGWIVSETTSPVDYSPIITATMTSQPAAKDAAASFVIRCRGQRTDLLVGTDGSWQASRTRELQVDFRFNNQPAVRTQWSVSADGRTALFRDDAVRFLRSLPDEGQMMVRVSDAQGAAHDSSFQLAGLEAIRQKIASTCKWAPAADRR